MAVSEVGRQLAEIKARSGLSWAALSDAIGASSGDYVRKVAAGHRPGANLTRAVGELMDTGQVSKPVPRRTTASGATARVRAPEAMGTRSRTPAPTKVAAGGERTMFARKDGTLGWAQNVGTDREQFNRALASAGRGGKRVSLRVEVRTPDGRARWVRIGQKGGYRARDIPRRGDLGEWLKTQTVDRYSAGGGKILAVEVIANDDE